MATTGPQLTVNNPASSLLRAFGESTRIKKGSDMDGDSFLKMILDLGRQKETDRSVDLARDSATRRTDRQRRRHSAKDDDEHDKDKVSNKHASGANLQAPENQQIALSETASSDPNTVSTMATALSDKAGALAEDTAAFQRTTPPARKTPAAGGIAENQRKEAESAGNSIKKQLDNTDAIEDKSKQADGSPVVPNGNKTDLKGSALGTTSILDSSVPGDNQPGVTASSPFKPGAQSDFAAAMPERAKTAEEDKTNQLNADSLFDGKQTLVQGDAKGTVALKPSTADAAQPNGLAAGPAVKDQTNVSTIKVLSPINPSLDYAPAANSVATQQNSGESAVGFETTGPVYLKNYSFSPEVSETAKAQSTQTSLQELVAMDPSYESALSRIEGASAQEAGNQLTQDGSFQEGLFPFMQDGVATGVSGSAPLPGQATGTLSLGATWPTELAQWIGELNDQKRSHLTLELKPKHLGRLLLRVETNENEVKASISTESEHVKQLLDRGLTALRQQLESQGLVLGQLTIDVNQGQSDRSSYRSGAGNTRAKQGTRPGQGSRPLTNVTRISSDQNSSNQLISVFA